MKSLEVVNLVKDYQIGKRTVKVLKGVSLTIGIGKVTMIQGASGAGKSTLLQIMAGLDEPTSGDVLLDGGSLFKGCDLPGIRNKRFGFIFQSYQLLPELDAMENVLLPASISGKPDSSKVKALLEEVGLADRAEHRPTELSGGEQQRVAIARALVNDPDVIFADEPTGNLDSKTGDAIIEILLHAVKSRNKTLVMVTHDERLAVRGDTRVNIVDGRIE
ncbi:MAG: ABC transporter ATP-binding protein [Verrucomicrobiota bacterium]|nr:ABC transporter ATP-binding protein [Verrucomicrobiota bacterium]